FRLRRRILGYRWIPEGELLAIAAGRDGHDPGSRVYALPLSPRDFRPAYEGRSEAYPRPLASRTGGVRPACRPHLVDGGQSIELHPFLRCQRERDDRTPHGRARLV